MTATPIAQELGVGAGSVEAVLLPRYGARLHRLRVLGQDLLRTPDDVTAHERDPFFWGAYHMAPWCNRVSPGPFQVGGRMVDLQSNFRDGSAIHGQVYGRPWEQIAEGALRVRAGGDGWPWPYEVAVRVTVDDETLALEQRLTNLADEPMPAGLGLHAWFRRRLDVVVRADRVYGANSDSPTHPQPVSGQFDLRQRGAMSDGLDATWVDLGDPPVELYWPELGLAATLRSSLATLHLTAASPPEIDAVAIEPQSHAPDALRRLLKSEPGAPTWLEPGGTVGQVIEATFKSSDPARDGG